MARYKTFANSGSLTPADLNSVSDEVDNSLSIWRVYTQYNLMWSVSSVLPTENMFFFARPGSLVVPTRVGNTWRTLGRVGTYINPQRPVTRVGNLRLRVTLMANPFDNGVKVTTVGLYTQNSYTVTQFGLGYFNYNMDPLPGSVVQIGKPTAAAPTVGVSASIPLPQTGHYAVGCITSNTMAPEAEVCMFIQIQQMTVRA